MAKRKSPGVPATPATPMTFVAELENIAAGMEYFAIPIPAAVTAQLATRRAVSTYCRVNRSERFAGNLVPWGQGRHYLRVRNQICKSVGIRAGDGVRVELVVRDRDEDVALPPDLARALRGARATAGFAALSLGKKSYLLRVIDDAVKPETRAKRIAETVEEARAGRPVGLDRARRPATGQDRSRRSKPRTAPS